MCIFSSAREVGKFTQIPNVPEPEIIRRTQRQVMDPSGLLRLPTSRVQGKRDTWCSISAPRFAVVGTTKKRMTCGARNFSKALQALPRLGLLCLAQPNTETRTHSQAQPLWVIGWDYDHRLPILEIQTQPCFLKVKVDTNFQKAIPFSATMRWAVFMPPGVPRVSGKFMKESAKPMGR